MIDRIKWALLGRFIAAKNVRGFSAHWTSYACTASIFHGYNKLGSGCRIYNSEIGRFSYVASGTRICGARMGAFCSIGPECIIGDLAKHPTNWLSTHPAFYSTKAQANYTFSATDQIEELGRVIIGNDVWIGARAMVLDGCRIGDGAVIAAGAVVVSDVPPFALVGGVPAKVIRYRFPPDEAELIAASKWWELGLDELAKLKASPPFLEALMSVLRDNDPSTPG